jgi:hypothetical protein
MSSINHLTLLVIQFCLLSLSCNDNEAPRPAPPPPRFARYASSSGPPPPLTRGGWRERSGSRDAHRVRVLPSHSKKEKRTSMHQTSLTERTEDRFFFRPVRGGRTPTDADPTSALSRGARPAGRARLSAFHRGSCLGDRTPPLSPRPRFLGLG